MSPVMSDPSQLLNAAHNFRRLLKNADLETLEKAQQILAKNACDSQYATTHEPLAAIVEGIGRELLQRMLNYKP